MPTSLIPVSGGKMFFEGFEKAAQKAVAKVGIFRNGKYLMGVRQDTGKWTEPGGHLESGESPEDGALREVKEETGITLSRKDLQYLGSKEVPNKDLVVHAFKAKMERDPRTNVDGDPDDEVFGWDWVPLKGKKLPEVVNKNLHVPAKDNVLHFFLGFEKSAANRSQILGHMKLPQSVRSFVLDTPNQAVQEYSEKYYERKRERRKKKESSPQ